MNLEKLEPVTMTMPAPDQDERETRRVPSPIEGNGKG